jgi:hypothetical protein
MKWKQASAKYRKDIARALTAATPAMLTEGRGRPDELSIRRALSRWGFNTKQRAEPPADVAEVLGWVARNSTLLSALTDAATARRLLEQATGRLDGKTAAASTARRHRTILANAMDYAVELGWSRSGPGTALMCYCGSTPSASSAKTNWPSAGSPKRSARTDPVSPPSSAYAPAQCATPSRRSFDDLVILARIWHSDPHKPASSRAQPHKRQRNEIEKAEYLRRSQCLDERFQ